MLGLLDPDQIAEVKKLFVVFAKTLQYGYLFGIVPALMMAAVDDILSHVRRISWVVRMLIVGVLGFSPRNCYYGSREPDSGARPVHSLRPGGPGAGDAVVVAGAQICRAEAGADSRDRVTQLVAVSRVTM